MTYCDLTDLAQDQCSHCVGEPDPALEAMKFARQALDQHGLTDWTVKWDSAKRRFGQCSHSKRTISLSKHWVLVRDAKLTRDTILHEVAHALVGPGHGHGPVWVYQARALGISGNRCGDSGGASIPCAVKGTCSAGHVVEQHRLPRRVSSCPKCSRNFNPRAIFTWTRDGKAAKMGDQYRQELAAIQRRYGMLTNA